MPTREATESRKPQAPDLQHAVMDIVQASTDVSTLTAEGAVVEVAEVEVVEAFED